MRREFFLKEKFTGPAGESLSFLSEQKEQALKV